ncbi:MAG: peptide MFS transporter [Planctomycetota bacterium]
MLKGHPKGLYRLFFIEMWERLAFYTMVGILFLYTVDNESGGLGMRRTVGAEIYGLYLAFVYFTPYLGGIVADRFLGYRRSVLIGGIFFASGFFLMSLGASWSFVTGLVCLCVGNGFFKPNISAMVGNLYEPGDKKRDAGFNIFYMGINIGAFIANFLAAIMRNEYGWLAIFLAAGFGMCIGIVILLMSWKTLEAADRTPGMEPGDTPFGEMVAKILVPALAFGVGGYLFADNFLPESVTNLVRPSDFGFLIGAIPIIWFFVNLARTADEEEKPGLAALLPIYIAGGTFFMVLHLNGSAMTAWANENTNRESQFVAETLPWFAGEAYPSYYSNAADDVPRPNRATLLPIASEEQANMFGQKRMDAASLAELTAKLPADVTVQDVPLDATDRSDEQKGWAKYAPKIYDNVEIEESTGPHGEREITVKVDDGAKPSRMVAFVRNGIATYMLTQATFDGLFTPMAEGVTSPELPPGQYLQTANAELYQSLNAFFVITLTPLVVLFFAWVTNRGGDFSTARKIFTGMVVTTLSVLFMAMGGFVSNEGAIKVSWLWLVGFYGIVTIGELCLSPMALSLVTKLSPKRLVGLTMGGWFFATAVGNKFSGFLGGLQGQMEPSSFFLVIAAAVALVALFIFVLLPKLDTAIKKYGA